jgi:hypothetical protein
MPKSHGPAPDTVLPHAPEAARSQRAIKRGGWQHCQSIGMAPATGALVTGTETGRPLQRPRSGVIIRKTKDPSCGKDRSKLPQDRQQQGDDMLSLSPPRPQAGPPAASPARRRRAFMALTAGLLLAVPLLTMACDKDDDAADNQPAKPWFSFVGGGFIFNYREADSYYGFVAKVERSLPEGAIVEAAFENPAGGPELLVTQPAAAGRITYNFRSPPLTGVIKERPYKAILRLRDGKSDAVLGEISTSFSSSVDQSVMPTRPLVNGPGDSDTPSWMR